MYVILICMPSESFAFSLFQRLYQSQLYFKQASLKCHKESGILELDR